MNRLHRFRIRKLNMEIPKVCAWLLCFLMLANMLPVLPASYVNAAQTATISIQVEVESEVSSDTVTVMIEPQNDAPEPTETAIAITGSDEGIFDGFVFPTAGDYEYVIRQEGTSDGILYDETVYTVTVRVTEEEDGLAAAMWAVRDDETTKTQDIVFENTATEETSYYIVEHYLQQTDGSYELADCDTYTAFVGETVTAVPNTYEGYHENTTHAERIPSGVVTAAGADAAAEGSDSTDTAEEDDSADAEEESDSAASATTSAASMFLGGIVTAKNEEYMAAADETETTEGILVLKLYYDIDSTDSEAPASETAAPTGTASPTDSASTAAPTTGSGSGTTSGKSGTTDAPTSGSGTVAKTNDSAKTELWLSILLLSAGIFFSLAGGTLAGRKNDKRNEE